MGKLTTYTAPVSTPEIGGQRATPENMGSAIGAGLETLSKGTHHFYTQMEEDESRTALVAASQIRAKYAAALDEAQVSGADTAPLKEKMTDELGVVGQNFNTKKGFDSLALHSAQTSMMFDDQANRIAVHRASEAAQLQGKQFLDSESATLRSAPQALPMSLANVDAFIGTLQNVPPTKKALIREQLVEQLNLAAVMSSTRIDPYGTKTKLENGEWTLTAANRETAIHSAESHIREIRADERAARQDAEYVAHKASEEASQTVLKNLFAGNLTDASIFNNADILPNKKEDLLHFKEWYTAAKGDRANKPHPVEMMELWTAIHAPSDDPRKIYNADMIFRYAEAGKLNAGEAEKASSWVANQKDENNVKFMSRLQGKMSTIRAGMTADPKWAAQGELSAAVQLEIMSRAEIRSKELRREGPNGQDPTSIFDPDSKNFMFKPGLLESVATDIRAQHRNLTTPQPKTPEEYKVIEPGTVYVDTDGRTKIKGRPEGTGPAPRAATSLDIQAGYIEPIPRTNSVRINAPQRSLARQLNGKVYESREVALEAMKALTERRE
jgi:hypothetical protein